MKTFLGENSKVPFLFALQQFKSISLRIVGTTFSDCLKMSSKSADRNPTTTRAIRIIKEYKNKTKRNKLTAPSNCNAVKVKRKRESLFVAKTKKKKYLSEFTFGPCRQCGCESSNYYTLCAAAWLSHARTVSPPFYSFCQEHSAYFHTYLYTA